MAPGPLRVPDLGRVEGAIVLTSWLVASGTVVVVGQEVVELETSKVTFAVESDRAGTLFPLAVAGARLAVGDPLADILP
ncbi:hypothetical protein IIA16_00710 [bacterium]|nr:hypothetical protein [bacterium]